jgi:cytochrome c-type biogenesis protein CcmH
MGWRRLVVASSVVAMLFLGTMPAAADSVGDVADQVMCQCGCNLILSGCNMMDCGVADQMTERIRVALAAGESGDQIVAGFVADYGDQVLSAPTKEGFNLFAWYTPFVALVAGAALVYGLIYAWSRRGAEAEVASTSFSGTAADEAVYRQRLEREPGGTSVNLVLALLLAALVFGYVGYPLLGSREDEDLASEPEIDDALDDLLIKRESTFAAIQEIEFDHEVGSLSDEDYRDLDIRYKERAVNVLKELDELQQDEDLDDAVERQVQALRRGRSASQASEAAQEIETGSACPECGRAVGRDDAFCAKCGAALRLTCASCQAPLNPEDRFCAKCGVTVEAE